MSDFEIRLQEQLHAGVALHRKGELSRALAIYHQVLKTAPLNFDALQLVGALEGQRKNSEVAVGFLRRANSIRPDDVSVLGNLGAALLDLDRCEQALQALERAVELSPDDPNILKNHAAVLRRLGRLDEAVKSYLRLTSVQPNHAEALHFLGLALSDLGRHGEAIEAFQRVLKLQPARVETLNALGIAFRADNRLHEAVSSFQAVVDADPSFAIGYSNLGDALYATGATRPACDACSRAIQLDPELADAHNNLGNCLFRLGDTQAALASYSRALELRTDWVAALCNRGMAHMDAKNSIGAAADFKRAVSIAPDHDWVLGHHWYAQQQVCDWSEWDATRLEMLARIRRGANTIPPFPGMMLGSAPAQLANARIWSRSLDRDRPVSRYRAARTVRRERIRVAYLSADFRRHATMVLASGLFAAHDKNRFDVTGIFHGAFPADDMTATVAGSFDRFFVTQDRSEEEIVALTRSLEIDIAIDLMGYTRGCMPGIFRIGAAPVQISFLGFTGTTGCASHSYIIADRTVIPDGDRRHYDEKVVWLPDTYLPSDNRRVISSTGMTRGAMGLPETGIVFCCFNNTYKITPAMCDLWARILREVAGSVLWLKQPPPEAVDNLRREMADRQIGAERLIFAIPVGMPQHLERHGLADLFLDTLPFNAHTTASDALWAGLPLVTIEGDSFAGRVAGSLLRSVGLPELIAQSEDDYVALAVTLARIPGSSRTSGISCSETGSPIRYSTPSGTRAISKRRWRLSMNCTFRVLRRDISRSSEFEKCCLQLG